MVYRCWFYKMYMKFHFVAYADLKLPVQHDIHIDYRYFKTVSVSADVKIIEKQFKRDETTQYGKNLTVGRKLL